MSNRINSYGINSLSAGHQVIQPDRQPVHWLHHTGAPIWNRRTIPDHLIRIDVAASVDTPPMPRGQFDIIYADPPWRYKWSGMNSKIEKHYPTMDLQDIKSLQIPSAADSVLYLWTPPAILGNALEVMEAWGFRYRSHAVWDKEIMGLGVWWRNQHELLLVGRKGTFPVPPPSQRLRSVFREKRTVHSKKPHSVYEMIEHMYPGMRYLELFARNRRRGWRSWGNEV